MIILMSYIHFYGKSKAMIARIYIYIQPIEIIIKTLVCLECAMDSGTPCDALNALLCITANTSVPRAVALIVVH